MYRYLPSWLSTSAYGPPPVPKGDPGTCVKPPVTASMANTETFLPLAFGTKRNLPAGSMAAANGLLLLAAKGGPGPRGSFSGFLSSFKTQILGIFKFIPYTPVPERGIANAVLL